eukprot:scaffold1531_cov59-Phaeocystis_antarctica.AAC.9
MVRAKPVRAVAAMGLVPMSPVTWVVPVVVTPDLVRMAKSPAVPRETTGSGTSCGCVARSQCASSCRGASPTALVLRKLSARSSEPRESISDSAEWMHLYAARCNPVRFRGTGSKMPDAPARTP